MSRSRRFYMYREVHNEHTTKSHQMSLAQSRLHGKPGQRTAKSEQAYRKLDSTANSLSSANSKVCCSKVIYRILEYAIANSRVCYSIVSLPHTSQSCSKLEDNAIAKSSVAKSRVCYRKVLSQTGVCCSKVPPVANSRCLPQSGVVDKAKMLTAN